MTVLQNAIRVIEDQLMKGVRLSILFDFTENNDGELSVDYSVNSPDGHVASDLCLESFKAAIIAIAEDIKQRNEEATQ